MRYKVLVQALVVTGLGIAALVTAPPPAAAAESARRACVLCDDDCPTLNACATWCSGYDAGLQCYREWCEGRYTGWRTYTITCLADS